MRIFSICMVTVIGMVAPVTRCLAESPSDEPGFVKIFDGKSMEGWKLADEHKDAWHVEDGKLVCDGERCHLFYEGPLAPMKDFHFKAEVMTTPGSNAGIYFHTQYQSEGWPKFGYECQVNVSHTDPKKTSSLYAVENVSAEDLAANGIKDNEWYTQEIIVTGRRIQLIVNGKTMVDYTEPDSKDAFSKDFERRLGTGTIALQAHDPKSVCHFRNLRVKPL